MINVEASIATNNIILTDNRLLSFTEYLLTESIKIHQSVAYGLDAPEFNDRRTKPSAFLSFKSDASTIFKLNGYTYVLDLYQLKSDPFVVLRTNPIKDQNLTTDEIFNAASPERRHRAQSMPYTHTVLTFSYAISIALDLAKKFKLQTISFTAFDPVLLTKFYNALARNAVFLNSVKATGWSFTATNGKYTFTKK